MTADLIEEQWRLVYPPDLVNDGADYVFGTWETGVITLTRPAVDISEGRTDDQPMPVEDGVRFGREFTDGMNLTFTLGIDLGPGGSQRATLDAVSEFRRVWRADALRSRPAAVAELHAYYGDTERIVYGRPRRSAPGAQEYTRQGYQAMVAEFQCVDTNWYDGELNTLTVPIIPATYAGLTAPLTAPLTMTSTTSTGPMQVQIGGKSPAFPVLTLYGPGTDLLVEFQLFRDLGDGVTRYVGPLDIGIRGSLNAGEWVRIDPRPFSRAVINQAGGSLSGRLIGTTRLKDLRLPVGTHQVVLRGSDLTGTARADVQWRSVWPSE